MADPESRSPSGDTPEHDVDPALLAERRARRAELSEQANARRAAEAEEALATVEAELDRAEARLTKANEDRARLDADLHARERGVRTAQGERGPARRGAGGTAGPPPVARRGGGARARAAP